MSQKLMRLRPVLERRGVGRTKHYDDIVKGIMTPPVCAGGRARAWPEDEIDAITAARIAGKSEDEIRALVKQLVAKRASAMDAVSV
jgi:prophage regulatory protein